MFKKIAFRVSVFVLFGAFVMLSTCLIFGITDLKVISENVEVAMFGAVFGMLTQLLGWVTEPLEKKERTSLD